MRVMTRAPLFGALIALAACEEGPTTMGWGVVVSAMSDEPAAVSVASSNHAYAGSFHAAARAAVYNGADWVELGGLSPVEVALQSPNGALNVNGSVAVPTGTYARVRLVLARAEVRLRSADTAGGTDPPGEAVIRVGNGEEFVIERAVDPFQLTGRTRVRVTFDLNSHLWVDEQAAMAGEVDPATVGRSATAQRQVEPR